MPSQCPGFGVGRRRKKNFSKEQTSARGALAAISRGGAGPLGGVSRWGCKQGSVPPVVSAAGSWGEMARLKQPEERRTAIFTSATRGARSASLFGLRCARALIPFSSSNDAAHALPTYFVLYARKRSTRCCWWWRSHGRHQEELAGEEPAGEEEDEDINWDEVDWV